MKRYTINTAEDLRKALEEIAEADFLAEMADDFSVWRREKDAAAEAKRDVLRQAAEKGIL
jgi:hypothetical protein